MGWLGHGALIAGVIAVAGCTSPEPPRDAGQLETIVLDVPLDIIAGSDLAPTLQTPPPPPVCPAQHTCAPAR